jgi:hypothetical protein
MLRELRRDIAGIIGAEILHHFRVTFDYPRERLIFEQFETPNVAEAGDYLGKPTAGSQRAHGRSRTGQLAAAEAGLKVGDVLVSFNDRRPQKSANLSSLKRCSASARRSSSL